MASGRRADPNSPHAKKEIERLRANPEFERQVRVVEQWPKYNREKAEEYVRVRMGRRGKSAHRRLVDAMIKVHTT